MPDSAERISAPFDRTTAPRETSSPARRIFSPFRTSRKTRTSPPASAVSSNWMTASAPLGSGAPVQFTVAGDGRFSMPHQTVPPAIYTRTGCDLAMQQVNFPLDVVGERIEGAAGEETGWLADFRPGVVEAGVETLFNQFDQA